MTDNKFTIGDTVLVSEKSHYSPGQTGTVIVKNMREFGTPYIGVQFLQPQYSLSGISAHSCDGAGKNGHCWWIRPEHLALVEKAGSVVTSMAKVRERRAGMKAGTKTNRVLNHLIAGNTITAGEAVILFSLFRLASVIHDLREAGHNITTTMKEDVNGTPYAEYKLVQKKRQVAA
jgi:hypothetical protein